MPLSPPSPTLRVTDRVVELLAERIRTGIYKDGELLPTERTLAADLGVHRRSVRMAVEQLVQMGLVSHRPNCRPVVGQQAAPSPAAPPLSETTQRSGTAAPGERRSFSQISASNLVALIMWHGGGPLEHAGSSQQRIFWGMNQALMKLGYHAVFLDLGGEQIGTEEQNAAREAEHLRYIRDQGFGGALFYPYSYHRNTELVREVNRTVPIVLLDRRMPGVDPDFVGVENHNAMRRATEHLISQGHRRIVHFTRFETIQSVQDRILGYFDAMRAPLEDELRELVISVPEYRDDRYWPYIDALFHLPKDQRPTAAVCVNDYIAVHIAERLERHGLSVPDDVALTGFDNIVPALPNGLGLTTIAQPYEEIGSTAVDLLMQRIKDPSAPARSIELPAQLIVRGSTASEA